MSVSLILVPLAVATVAAVRGATAGRDDDGRIVCQVKTRMRDAQLLGDALRQTGAVVDVDTDTITATWASVRARFQRDAEGVWTAHLAGEVDEARAVQIVQAVDVAYGQQVQRAVVERLRNQAGDAGLRLESEETAEDASVRLVFTVEGRPA